MQNNLSEQIKEFIGGFKSATSPEAVERHFAKLDLLDKAVRIRAVDLLEKIIVRDWVNNLKGFGDVRDIAGYARSLKGDASGREELLELNQSMQDKVGTLQTAGQIFSNIKNEKGDKAAPLTTAYVEIAARLSAAEYNSFTGHMELWAQVADKMDGIDPQKLKLQPAFAAI